MDEDTAAVIVNSPSNPCGSVYSRQHIEDILEVLDRNKIPVIADEIYEHFVSIFYLSVLEKNL
jgi:tyrosine aminotransferase